MSNLPAAEAGLAPPYPLLTIKPRRSWLPSAPRELWAFRELMVRFASRDITLRYRQTALGVVWVILVPLFSAGVLSFVFGAVADLPAPAGIPYFLFTLAGMVTWTSFAQTVGRSSGSLVGNGSLLGKVYFPRLLLPLSTALSTLVDVSVSLVLLAVVSAIYGVHPGLGVIMFPVWLLAVLALALGIGFAGGALMVRYRDVGFILTTGIQFLLYASPVAYTLASVPPGALWIFKLNPLTGLLEGTRWSLIGTTPPSVGLAAYAIGFSLVTFVAGILVFSRMESQFADVI